MTEKPPTTIDEYLAGVRDDQRAALETLRQTILSVLPDAQECLSYNMPAFRVEGKIVAGFAAYSKNCGYYPFSGGTLGGFAEELKGFKTTKGAVQFTPEKPLPTNLVKALILARLAE